MRKYIFLLLVVCILSAIALSKIFVVQDNFYLYLYDLRNKNQRIVSVQQIDSILSEMPSISFANLDEEYKSKTKSSEKKYSKLLAGSNYKIINRNDFYRKLVGNYRVRDFVCKDVTYNRAVRNSKKEFYWLMDEKLPRAILKLQQQLEAKGYDPDGFRITYGHRHPQRNEAVKGASSSKHILGQAIDLVVYDINKDGKYSDVDKQILLDIAEKQVIADKGGIGRYPGTRTVHLDVRGYRARWDTY